MAKINGIQHIGVAVSDMNRTLPLYRRWFGMDIPFFDSIQPAPLMRVFTRNEVVTKRASMVMNLKGGCAMEVIEPTSFKAKPLPADFQLGDIGIFAVHMRMNDPQKALMSVEDSHVKSGLSKDPCGKERFLIQDPDGLYFLAVEDAQVFRKNESQIGGVSGLSIGVSNIASAKEFYALLGFDQVLYQGNGIYPDLAGFPGGDQAVDRLILRTARPAAGPFGAVIGYTQLELICTPQRKVQKIFRGRIWADTGFVHLGLDVLNMKGLQALFVGKGIPIRCDSNEALSMGQTKVHCAYVCDPDGILIELIEVFKIPLIEKWGLFLNVHGKRSGKHLPKWLVGLLRFSKIKD